MLFLTVLYERGIGYSQISKAHSALSVLYPDVQIGQNSLISRFFHGVRNLCTPQPKYPFLWDAKDLLLHLVNWPISPMSPLKDITLKLTTGLACISAQRLHTLLLLEVRYITFNPSATYLYIFSNSNVICQRPCFIITLPSYSDADRLQPVELLRLYIRKTKPFCIDKYHQLLLSWCPPTNLLQLTH